MSNIVDNEKECDFQQWYLRKKAQRERVSDLDEFINDHT